MKPNLRSIFRLRSFFGFFEGAEMVDCSGDSLNTIFAELANWEEQLRYANVDLSNEFGGLEP